MNTDEEALSAVYKKIEREKALITAANAMRQQTQNEQVRSKLDTQMREGRRNIQFFEEKMRELQIRTVGQNMDSMRLGGPEGSGQQGGGLRNDRDAPPTPPPKDSRGNYIEQIGTDQGGYGSGDYSTMFKSENPSGMMPPRHPYAPPAPGSAIPKARANYSKLGLYFWINLLVVVELIFARSHQIRYSLSRTPHSAHAVAISIQARC